MNGGSQMNLHTENYTSISFQIEWDTIVGTVFLLIFYFLNQMEFYSVQKIERKTVTTILPIQFERKSKYSFLSVTSHAKNKC